MKKEPTNKYFGTSLSEWISRIPNELEVDAVGLWQIIPAGKDSFDLSDEDLDNFTRRCIYALMERGAWPVRPSFRKDKFWERQFQYGDSREEIAENIIKEWKKIGIDPDQDGVWFALGDY